MLNTRHKAILFISLVVTGCALLLDASMRQALGILILGIAFAWLIGSERVLRLQQAILRLPGQVTPWLRLPLVMAVGGGILAVAAYWSTFNGFVVVAVILAFGMLMSPLQQAPTQARGGKVVVWIVGILTFFFAAVSVSMALHMTGAQSGRLGELAAAGIVAMPLGMFWTVKGWRLLIVGIRPAQADDNVEKANVSPANQKGTLWLYLFLACSVLLLALFLGLLAFNAFSDSMGRVSPVTETNRSVFPLIGFVMLLALWPYTCWRRILERESNTFERNVKRHKRVAMALGMVFSLIVCLGITAGVQISADSMSRVSIEDTTKGFQEVAVKIGAIKSRDLRTTANYISAYAEIGPLLDDFDAKLTHMDGVMAEAKAREERRGIFNIQKLYKHHRESTSWNTEVSRLLKEDSVLTRKQVALAEQMATIPGEDSQIQFWNERFLPLVEEEQVLRQKLAALMSKQPAGTK